MGGNVFVYSKNNNEIFTIGIKHPRENGIIATVKVKSGTFVATSGDYERFFEYKGVRYCF
jgi:thiamine biosynthesis lipoprotein